MNPRGTVFAHLVAKKRFRDPGSRLLRAILGVSRASIVPPPLLPAPSTPGAACFQVAGRDEHASMSVSFKTLVPPDAYDTLKAMKARLARISRPVKKAELVHAGIDLLASLSDDELLIVLDRASRTKDASAKR